MLPLIIVNPASAGGATGDAWPGVASAVRRHFGAFEVAFTSAGGEASDIAEREARAGRPFVIACGGEPVRVHFGPVLDLAAFYDRRDSVRTYKEIADFCMAKIAELGEQDAAARALEARRWDITTETQRHGQEHS